MGKSFDWKDTLATVAPAIATALGSPLAGVAVGMAADALGLNERTQEALEVAVAGGGPEVLEKLKAADNAFKLEMERIGVQYHLQDVEDRKSARLLGVEKGTLVQTVLSSVLGFTFAYVLISIFEGEMQIDEGMRDIAIYALGTLNTLLVQVFNYWFGSSSGSRNKSTAMEKLLK